ncbi:MAG: exo-alpha-sialidase [Pseudonocardiaceae bacterium]|nr:exo-alpha-sialidase [Pseudonocardiaceae bacterium]
MPRSAARVGILLCAVLAAALLAPLQAAPAPRATGELLHEGPGKYPRLIRLENSTYANGRILASITSQDENGWYSPIYQSTDEGDSFRQVGEVRDPEAKSGQCCATLYELPRQVGDLPAGTLLWAASIGQDAGDNRRIAIKVWYSTNVGRSWSFLSEVDRSPNRNGKWEPEFSVDANGTLWTHYADETEAPKYSQVVARKASTDGVNWGEKQATMRFPPDPVRPGMPIVRRLPDGRYYMSYEICNLPNEACGSYFKISTDGANWGDPQNHGTRVQTPGGRYFQHAHTIALAPGGENGTRILHIGQIYTENNGTAAPGNGQMILANDNYGSGPWYEVQAPVHVPNPRNHTCPNFSSSVLPVNDGAQVLEVAADFAEDGTCKTYFGKGPLKSN